MSLGGFLIENMGWRNKNGDILMKQALSRYETTIILKNHMYFKIMVHSNGQQIIFNIKLVI